MEWAGVHGKGREEIEWSDMVEFANLESDSFSDWSQNDIHQLITGVEWEWCNG